MNGVTPQGFYNNKKKIVVILINEGFVIKSNRFFFLTFNNHVTRSENYDKSNKDVLFNTVSSETKKYLLLNNDFDWIR